MVPLCHRLRHANGRLGPWLDHLVPVENNPLPPTPEQLSSLLSELLDAGAALRAQPLPPTGIDPELDFELNQYRRHVERLREILPAIHSELLLERSRLEAQRSRVKAAAEWARASRQTF
jgi:hypothetical protein